MKIEERIPIDIKLPGKGVTLMLKPNCNGHACSVSVRDRNHNRAWPISQLQLFHIKGGHDDGLFKPFHSTNAKEFRLTVLVHSYKFSSHESNFLNFSLEAFTTGCFYWSQLESLWSSRGCKVDKQTANQINMHYFSLIQL